MTNKVIPNKVVIFDVGGVILFCDHMLICRRLSNLCESTPSDIYQFIFKDGLEKLYDEGEMSSREFYEKIRQGLKASMEFDEFRQIWSDIYEENLSVTQLIKELKKNNYKMYLLSNTNELHYLHIRNKYKILEEFDDYILSYKVGYRKPSQVIFKSALEKSGLPASNHIYIDDMEEHVDVAQSIDMIGILFRSTPQLRSELHKNGILLVERSK
jgi:HAD superfamily hydrolase (TIGR01509 family)